MDEMTTLPNYDFQENEKEKLMLEIKGKNVTIDNLAEKIKLLENNIITLRSNENWLMAENTRLRNCLKQINEITTGGPK